MNTLMETIPGYYQKNIIVSSPFGNYKDLICNKYIFFSIILLISIFASALGVVYIHGQDRVLFSQLSNLQKKRDGLYVEWGQLLLEDSALSTQARLQYIAEHNLNMVLPSQKNIVILSK